MTPARETEEEMDISVVRAQRGEEKEWRGDLFWLLLLRQQGNYSIRAVLAAAAPATVS